MLSVVIITFNESANIVDCVRSARTVSEDVVVVDSGSTDDTVALARQAGARTFSIDWVGYGHSRNYGAGKALNDWILALDADERITPALAHSLRALPEPDSHTVFRFRRRNFLNFQAIRFGTLGFEKVTRVYHRCQSSWDLTLVHEKLVGRELKHVVIAGSLLHYGWKDAEDYRIRAVRYARLSAAKYRLEGREAGWLKRIGSPLFNAFKSYVLQFGFLEGGRGLTIARTIFHYSWMKYHFLHELQQRREAKLELRDLRAQLEVRA